MFIKFSSTAYANSEQLIINLSLYDSTALLLDLGRFSVSLSFTQSVGLLGQAISPSQGRYLTQTQNKRTQTSMPQVGFEPTITVFQRTKPKTAQPL
jgi:hypothetical protein